MFSKYPSKIHERETAYEPCGASSVHLRLEGGALSTIDDVRDRSIIRTSYSVGGCIVPLLMKSRRTLPIAFFARGNIYVLSVTCITCCRRFLKYSTPVWSPYLAVRGSPEMPHLHCFSQNLPWSILPLVVLCNLSPHPRESPSL